MENNQARASAEFREILTTIERAREVPVRKLRELGNDNPALHSLEVDRYTVGPRFFGYQSRKREEVHKRLLARSFIHHTQIDLNTREQEIRFREWEAAAFPPLGKHFNDDLQAYNEYNYHKGGHFVVECLFILEVIRRFTLGDVQDEADGLSWIKLLLKARHDLIIYDNQLPFYVLEEVYYMAFPNKQDPDFLRICIQFFSDCMLITNADEALNLLEQQRIVAADAARNYLKQQIDAAALNHLEQQTDAAALNHLEQQMNYLDHFIKQKAATALDHLEQQRVAPLFNHLEQQWAAVVAAHNHLRQEGDAALTYLEQQKAAPAVITDFIDLVRKCHAPMKEFLRRPPDDALQLTPMRKVNYLEEAGMTIKAPANHISVCSICYGNGLLQIPRLRINNKSRHLLRNLMEHEIQHHAQDTFIIDYLHFMGSIIDTAEDVDLLVHNGIIVNLLSNSKEVAALFNSITTEAPFIASSYYYHGVCVEVNQFCQTPRHRWRATLKRDYCRSPCMAASTTAAIILLLLTFIRTVWSIISIK